MAFVRRKIQLLIKIGKNYDSKNNPTAYDTLTLDGLRVRANITRAGGSSASQAEVRLFGMKMSEMAQIAGLNVATTAAKENVLIINAGDDGGALNTTFIGGILLTQIDMQNAPDVSLVLLGQEGLWQSISYAEPLSYPNSAKVSEIMKTLADRMGLIFENSIPEGDPSDSVLSTPYFSGNYRWMVDQCANAGRINYAFDAGVLAIWPRDGYRKGTVPLISSTTGMVGYPSYSNIGIAVKTQYNPLLKNASRVRVESALPVANGEWRIFNLAHELESESPNGAWFTRFDAQPIYATPS
jgi:hypothetical protein